MSHPNLSDQINHNIVESEVLGGCWLKNLPVGHSLRVTTKNRVYLIHKHGENDYRISGHPVYCPVSVKASIHGSTWGGSMLKIGFVGRGMRLEFRPEHVPGQEEALTVTTSVIEEVEELWPEGLPEGGDKPLPPRQA